MISVCTIGFTKKSAQSFFEAIKNANVKRVIDVRLNNVSQLSGFSKRDDLRYFLSEICSGVEYHHEPILAPTKEILDAFKKHKGTWEAYTEEFMKLMAERKIEDNLNKEDFEGACLLCSEHEPHHCHRRLVLEYLKRKWGDMDIRHLGLE